MLIYYQAKTDSDCKFIAALYNNPKNNQYLWTRQTNTAEVRKRLAMPNRKMFILVADKQKIGYFNLQFVFKGEEVMLGIIIDQPFWGQGFGTQSLRLAAREAKKLGVKKITLEVFSENKRAIRLYKKSGYKQIGKTLVMAKRI